MNVVYKRVFVINGSDARTRRESINQVPLLKRGTYNERGSHKTIYSINVYNSV